MSGNSEHIGEIGKRIEIEVVIIRKDPPRFAGGAWWVFLIMRDDDGNEVICGSYPLGEVGERIRVSGVIAEHRVFNGTPQTVLKNVVGIQRVIPIYGDPEFGR